MKFYLFSVIGVLLAAIYPLSMGIRVVSDMITSGVVLAENYPKYTIPYTPIAIAVFLGVLEGETITNPEISSKKSGHEVFVGYYYVTRKGD